MPNVQEFMDPTQAAAINGMGPGVGGQPSLPVQPDAGNPVADLLAQVVDLVIKGQGDPAHAAAIEQFLEFIMSLQPGGQPPQQPQAPLGQGPGGGVPLPPTGMPQPPLPVDGGSVTPLPLPSR